MLIFVLLTLVLAAAAAAWWIWRDIEAPLAMASERIELRIAPGATARNIAQSLREQGVDLRVETFVAAARVAKVTTSLRAGRYEITRGMTLHDVLEKLRRGETLREKLTVVEGWTFRELRAALAAHAGLKQDSRALTDAQLLSQLGVSAAHAEGWFAPDTYVFDAGSSDLDVLRQAHRQQQTRLTTAWSQRGTDSPLKTPYEALILASIIEKETGAAAERPLIGGVFVNRLRKSMLLQTDPTVIYGLGEKFDGNLRKRDLNTDTPYNTYTRAGLPPTPIALPGQASLDAAVRPAETEALYFVARGDGTSAFSVTLSEHNRAVARYQLNQGGK
jgi:UPF0755 protein